MPHATTSDVRRRQFQNWYSGNPYHVEQFRTLSTTQQAFANLVQAMSGVASTGSATSIADVGMTQPQRDAINAIFYNRNGNNIWQ